MKNHELSQFLERAIPEFERLRRDNEVMGAKLEVYDTFALLVRGLARPGGGYASEDLLWVMKERLAKLKAQEASEADAA